ncbi:MAG: hypothetical protein ABSB40_06850 [Nitrososphaeria archaeon]|jgi:hypothetical protein
MNNKINVPLENMQDNKVKVFDQTFTHLFDVNKVFGMKIMFHERDCDELKPIVSLFTSPIPLNVEPFEQLEELCDVAGIDSSCISIGETEQGALYAVKSGVSIYYNGKPKAYHIYGPYVVYVDEQAMRQVYHDNRLREKLVKLVISEHEYAKNMVRVVIEREVLKYMSTVLNGSLILCDGSLRSSIFEVEGFSLKEIIECAQGNANTIVGISKSSKLKFIKRVANYLEILNYAPVKVDVHHIIDSMLSKVEGHIFVVKFKKHGYAFRTDIPYHSYFDVDSVLGKILNNDGFRLGYPESLIMSHSISIFNNVEQVSIKSALARSLNIIQVPATRLRKSLLGGLKFEGGSTSI